MRFVPVLFSAIYANIILSVQPSSTTVLAPNIITISLILTAPASIKLVFSSQFTLLSNCTVSSLPQSCSLSTSSSLTTIVFPGTQPAATLNLLVSGSNPAYADIFSVQAYANGVIFSNTAIVSTTAATITCSLQTASSLVGQASVGTFFLDNSALPVGSTITVTSPIETTFPNLFNSNPTCSSSGASSPCSLSEIFNQQILSVAVPTSPQLSFSVSTLNNPPFNASLHTFSIVIQNTNSKTMQVCSGLAKPPFSLESSTGLAYSNWNSEVGAQSTVTFTLFTYFTPFATTVLLVFSGGLTLNSTSSQLLCSATASLKSLSFTVGVGNPSVVKPLSLRVYVVYNSTLFVEQYSLDTLQLTTHLAPITSQIADTRTTQTTAYLLSIGLPFSVSKITLRMALSTPSLNCLELNPRLNTQSVNLLNCTTTQLWIAATPTYPPPLLSLSFTATNPLSIIPTTVAVNIVDVLYGNTTIQFTPNNPTIQIINSNPTFGAPTTLVFAETPSLAAFTRVVIITLPLDVDTTNASCSGCTLNPSSSGALNLTIVGPLKFTLLDVINPRKYNGSRVALVNAFDTMGVLSSVSSAVVSPQYAAAGAALSYSLSTRMIEQNCSLVVTVIPSLQYYSSPTVALSLQGPVLLSLCVNCTQTASQTVTLPYAPVLQIGLSIRNSMSISGNTLSLRIYDGSLTYETAHLAYTLSPLQPDYLASFSGEYGQIGDIFLTVATVPSHNTVIQYSDVSPVLSGAVCLGCNSTYLHFQGVVQYFQSFILNVTYTDNNTLYSSLSAKLYYTCYAIQGCRVCSNNGSNNGSSNAVICSKCFPSAISRFSLLYMNQCFSLCPTSTYSTNITCEACAELCFNCTSSGCVECKAGYILFNNSCVGHCPTGYMATSIECIPVPPSCPNCLTCISDGNCSVCLAPFSLLIDKCVAVCPSLYYASNNICLLAPEEATVFPFGFLIAVSIIFLGLVGVKHFERRSLIISNMLALMSIAEIGTMLLTLTYTLQASTGLLTQSLVFVLLLSKVLLNGMFMLYFCKKISKDDQFMKWSSQHHATYGVILICAGAFSFQCMRLLYSHLLGLPVFYARFKTPLIFKPIRNFSLLSILTTTAPLIYLCAVNIIDQHGFQTNLLFTSLETIIIQAIFILFVFLSSTHTDQHYFQYQTYKIQNSFDTSKIEPITVNFHAEEGGSMHDIIYAANNPTQNILWTKINAGSSKGEGYHGIIQVNSSAERCPAEENEREENEREGNGREGNGREGNGREGNGREGNGREGKVQKRKIIDEWHELQKTLPNAWNALRKKKDKPLSVEHYSKRDIHRTGSVDNLEKVQVRLPNFRVMTVQKIKHYFHHVGKDNMIVNRCKSNSEEDNVFNFPDPPTEHSRPAEEPSSIKAEEIQVSKGSQLIRERNSFEGSSLSKLIAEIGRDQARYNVPKSGAIELKSSGNDEFAVREDFQEEANRQEGKIRRGVRQQSRGKKRNSSSQGRRYGGSDEASWKEDDRGGGELKKRESKWKEESTEGFEVSLGKVKPRRVNKQTESIYLQRLSLSKRKSERMDF